MLFNCVYSFMVGYAIKAVCGKLYGHFVLKIIVKRLGFTSNYMYTNAKNQTMLWYQCNLELITCSDCVIRITFTHTNFSKICENPNRNIGNPTSRCPCDHIQFSEPPYEPDVSGHYFCGDGKVFRSQTRSLMMKFFYKTPAEHIFTLQYFSERNVKIISGSPRQSIVSNATQLRPNIISTPYFPLPYPRDYGIEHIFSCDSENCRVRLDFTDFQIGLTSTMEIFDSNGQMLDTYTGEHFRPPIVVSSGKSLLMQFRGNGVTGVGYRAEISFISEKQLNEKDLIPYTDCGGMVGSFGGAITMMNMLENASSVRYYDCIWIIKPGNSYMLMKTHISLRVDAFHGMASRSELVIKEGTTSIGQQLETVRWPGHRLSKRNHILPIVAGFYVRLKGVFGLPSRLAIVYSVFNYINCYIGSEFLCENNHCISIRLHCDGFDHCGDGSDEPEKCEEDWAHSPNDRRWYSHKPNYYFPKIEQYPDLKAATGIFIISTLGILLVISGWMVILYRIGIRTRNPRDLQNHLQTISELLDRQEEIPVDDPPDYEAPPDYEDVIKVGMDDQMRHSRRLNRPNGKKHHHRHRRQNHLHPQRNLSNGNASIADQNMPSCSTMSMNSDTGQSDQSDDNLSNTVLMSTAYCEIAETTPAASKRYAWKDQGCQTSTLLDYGASTNGADSSNLNHQENSSYSLGTPTQYEERSAEFRDESLNVSLTLNIPTNHTMTENSLSDPLRPKSVATDNNNCFKKTWLMFSSGGGGGATTTDASHTDTTSASGFLTPEAFKKQEMNYGSYLQSDRNSFLSTTSTFGSDLPIDCTPDGEFTQRSLVSENASPSTDHPPNKRQGPLLNASFSDHGITYKSKGCDNGSNVDVSCFGNVNIFGTTKLRRNHVRSKSFNQNDRRIEQRNTRLKRCSSADRLLLTTLSK
ncbi:unnamed protein product [Hermetia illucens]|uniref:CUB domain-containing protein n=1 Tax=Hermetia illucens TaxID=343691 RepID=A0A7R8UMB8_HERIL|nr:unnamed protein product [Hermetia illucens]